MLTGIHCLAGGDNHSRISCQQRYLASKAFKADCNSLDQKYTFSGVGAHHQNGVAERNVKTVAQ